MAAGVSKAIFCFGLRCPEIPWGQKVPERGPDWIQGGPASILNDFSSPFGSSGDPQGTTFDVLFGIFPAFLFLFRRFFFRALFGVVFRRFRDSGPLKYGQTTVVLHENTVRPKSKKLAPETDVGSILVTFWSHFVDISGHLGAKTTLFTASVFQSFFNDV